MTDTTYDEIQLIISAEDQKMMLDPITTMETAVRIAEEETNLTFGALELLEDPSAGEVEGSLIDENSRAWNFCLSGTDLNFIPID